ncbi:putative WD repeat-containing protein [Diplonema papillatum]|nr:putative WD repeat-containing protein [Diplonema papillatum]
MAAAEPMQSFLALIDQETGVVRKATTAATPVAVDVVTSAVAADVAASAADAPAGLAEQLARVVCKSAGGGGSDVNRVEYLSSSKACSTMPVWLKGLAACGEVLGEANMSESFIMHVMCARRQKLSQIRQDLASVEGGDGTVLTAALKTWFQSAVSKHGAQKVLDMLDAGFVYCSGPFIKIAEYLQGLEDAAVSNEETNTIGWWGIYSVINYAMREVGKRHADCAGAVCDFNCTECCGLSADKSIDIIKAFQPYLVHLRDLMQELPKRAELVFRGITVNVSRHYKIKTQFRWPSYTSTSLKQDTALEYMQGKEGTFFVIASYTACDVRFVALHDEGELLYRCNTLFEVGWKLSPTLLRMIGCEFDVVVVREVCDDTSQPAIDSDQRLDQITTVAAATSSLFSAYLDQYVEGRVQVEEQVKERRFVRQCGLYTAVHEWVSHGYIAADTDTEPRKRETRRPLCVTGDGGTGKTSAAIAVYSLLSRLRERGWGGRKVLPIFIALPTVSEKLLEEGALDTHVMEMYGLDTEAVEALAQKMDVVLIFDSLDETGLGRAQLDGALRGGGGVLGLQKWCAGCSVIVTTRTEYLLATGVTSSQICGMAVQEVKMQPFGDQDCQDYLTKVQVQRQEVGATDPVDTDTLVDAKLKSLRARGLGDTLANPFLLSMLVEAEEDEHGQQLQLEDQTQIYEGYLLECSRKKLRRKTPSGQPIDVQHVEDVLRTGERVACFMADTNMWQLPLKDAVAAALGASDTTEAVVDRLRCLPVRVEDWNDDNLLLSFRHKTIPEYLCARRLWREPAETLSADLSSRSFSKDTPNIKRFFKTEALRDFQRFTDVVKPALMVQVGRTRLAGGSNLMGHQQSSVKHAAANALSLASCVPFRGDDLSGVRVEDADLRMALFCNVRCSSAQFRNCWLEHAEFHGCDMSDVDLADSALGCPLPPLRGHADVVYSAAYSPDGSKLVSCSSDYTARLWDARKGKEVHLLRGHTKAVRWVAFSPDNKTVATCSADHTIKMWDAGTGEQVRTLEGHTDGVPMIAYSPDGSTIASCGWDKTIRVWAAADGCELRVMKGHTAYLSCIAYAASRIASGSADKTVRLWNAETGMEERILAGHTDKVWCVALSRNGATVASGGADLVVRLWDASTGNETHKLEGHIEAVWSAAFTPDGTKLATGSKDKTIRFWDVVTGSQVHQLEGHTEGVTGISFSWDGALLLSGSYDKTIRVWDAASRAVVYVGHTDQIYCISFSPDTSVAITCSKDKTLQTWDAGTGRQLRKLEGHTDGVRWVAFSPDGSKIASCSVDKTIKIWDGPTGDLLHTLEGHTDGVPALAFSPDGTKIASCSWDKTIRLWGADGSLLQTMTGHTAYLSCIAYAASRIASGSADKTVRLWDAATGIEEKVLRGHTDKVWCVALSPDGAHVLSSGNDTTIRMWDAASGSETHKLEGHSLAVWSVAFSPCGTKVVSGGKSHTMLMWNAASGQELHRLEGHTDSVVYANYSPDGSRVVSCSYDKTFRVWDTSATTGEGEQQDPLCILICGMPPRAAWCHSNCIGLDTVRPEAAREVVCWQK